jgi:hypothetical protein
MGACANRICDSPTHTSNEVVHTECSTDGKVEDPFLDEVQDGVVVTGTFAPFHLNVEVLNKEEVIKNKIKWLVSDPQSGCSFPVSPLAAFTSDYVISDEAFAAKVAQRLSSVLPEKALGQAGIKLKMLHLESESNGTSFVVEVLIEGFDLIHLSEKALHLDKAEAKEFAGAFEGIKAALTKMDMSHKEQEIEEKVRGKVRWKIMQKLAEALPKELGKAPTCLKIQLDIPELMMEKMPTGCDTDAQRGKSMSEFRTDCVATIKAEPFLVHAVIHDRHALLKDDIARKKSSKLASTVKGVVGGMVSDDTFDKIIADKLKHQIPDALRKTAGVQSVCRRIAKKEKTRHELNMDKSMSAHGVLVEVTLQSFESWPPTSLLTRSKGSEFAAGFEELWVLLQTLERLGIPGIQAKMQTIVDQLIERVRKGIQTKLTETLAERLYASVSIFDVTDEGLEFAADVSTSRSYIGGSK